MEVKASGCVFLSVSTGRILLQLRSRKVSHPGTWAFWGGKAHKEERPIETLYRELQEEIGNIPAVVKIYPLHQYKAKNNSFFYNTFIVVAYKEFVPILNDESSGYCWVDIGNWPKPLHNGAKSILYNRGLVKDIRATYNMAISEKEDTASWWWELKTQLSKKIQVKPPL